MKASDIDIIVGCEESQVVAMALRARGFNASSCDLKPCSGGNPQYHFQEDIFKLLARKKFHAGIFHPDCTYLSNTGNKWLKDQPPRPSGALVGAERREARAKAIQFVKDLYAFDMDLAIENPIGCLSTEWMKPTQIVSPHYFGDPHSKGTCLWLKGFPKLVPTNIVEPEMYVYANGKKDPMWHFISMKMKEPERSRFRSQTFPGIAAAWANQWGDYLIQKYNIV